MTNRSNFSPRDSFPRRLLRRSTTQHQCILSGTGHHSQYVVRNRRRRAPKAVRPVVGVNQYLRCAAIQHDVVVNGDVPAAVDENTAYTHNAHTHTHKRLESDGQQPLRAYTSATHLPWSHQAHCRKYRCQMFHPTEAIRRPNKCPTLPTHSLRGHRFSRCRPGSQVHGSDHLWLGRPAQSHHARADKYECHPSLQHPTPTVAERCFTRVAGTAD